MVAPIGLQAHRRSTTASSGVRRSSRRVRRCRGCLRRVSSYHCPLMKDHVSPLLGHHDGGRACLPTNDVRHGRGINHAQGPNTTYAHLRVEHNGRVARLRPKQTTPYQTNTVIQAATGNVAGSRSIVAPIPYGKTPSMRWQNARSCGCTRQSHRRWLWTVKGTLPPLDTWGKETNVWRQVSAPAAAMLPLRPIWRKVCTCSSLVEGPSVAQLAAEFDSLSQCLHVGVI